MVNVIVVDDDVDSAKVFAEYLEINGIPSWAHLL